MSLRNVFYLSALLLLCGAWSTALADVPDSIHVQGILLDSGGDPVTAQVEVTFTIYDQESNGTLLWGEIQQVTPDDEGRFNVYLGNGTPVPPNDPLDEIIFSATQRWLELTVTGDTPMPRVPFVTVPYAYRVATVDGSTGGTISGDVSIASDLDVDGDLRATGKATIGDGHTNIGDWSFVAGKDNVSEWPNNTISGGASNVALGSPNGYCAIGGGIANYALGEGGTIGGGAGNHTYGQYATVTGGYGNWSQKDYSTIAGGEDNRAGGEYSFVGGGRYNDAHGSFSVVVGGGGSSESDSNSAFGELSAVVGGKTNYARGNSSFIGGGEFNRADGAYSVIAGGGGSADTDSNSAQGDNSTIGGGKSNIASGVYSTISGGNENEITSSAPSSTVGGGAFNEVSGQISTIAGGVYNIADSEGTTVGGGRDNEATWAYATIGGGWGNKAYGSGATIAGGEDNEAAAGSAIGGGEYNRARGLFSVVAGGGGTEVDSNSAAGDLSSIGGGRANYAIGQYSRIGGGRFNKARGDFSVIAGGGGLNDQDSNLALSTNTTIGGGSSNVANGSHSTVGGGQWNLASGHVYGYATVSGGQTNRATKDNATISGGAYNEASGHNTTIGGGLMNFAVGAQSTVAGGGSNFARGDYSVVAGGGGMPYNTTPDTNSASGNYSSIGGGRSNVAGGHQSHVGGGRFNLARGNFSVIAGGGGDTYNDSSAASGDYSAIVGGHRNVAKGDYSFIGGGEENGSVGQWSVVPGGYDNDALGDYSFAAGRRANADHAGTFVWADDTDADFSSTGDDQFLIRAAGGVGVNTNNPLSPLSVTSENKWGWSEGNGWGDFSVGDGTYGLAIGVATGGGGAGTVRLWATDGEMDLHIGNSLSGEVLSVKANGRVGIGETNPGAELYIDGDLVLTGSCTGCSDVRYKTDIEQVSCALDKIARVRGVNFNWRTNEYPDHRFTDERQLGFIAQELREIMPEVVLEDDNGYLSVDYGRVTPILVEAIKELKAENDVVKRQLMEMKSLVEQLLADRE